MPLPSFDRFFWVRRNSVAITATAALLMFPGCDPKQPESNTPSPTPDPTPAATPEPEATATPVPSPTPTPVPMVDRKSIDISRLYNDLSVASQVLAIEGEETASQDRRNRDAYQVELTLNVRLPDPATTLEEIEANDPDLKTALPSLEKLLETAKVSPAFEELYGRKIDYTKARLNRLDTLLSRHNFFDCETILELEAPGTGRKAIFLQGDMDVNTDGSDGDRNYTVDGSSMFFQPQTSYRWRKLGDRPNPFLQPFRTRLAEAEKEFAIPGLSIERNRELRETIRHAKATIYELETYSFLISGADPYIVLPGFMINDPELPLSPKLGDYAAVIYDGVIYPAILGDAGPTFKVGEASVRLNKQLNERASANARAVSSLDVTYIVFPGTAEPKSVPPNLDLWHKKVSQLMSELDPAAPEPFKWPDVIKPWPTPTPAPSPSETQSM